MPPSRCCTVFRSLSTTIEPGAMTAPSIDARQLHPPNTPKVRNATAKPLLAGVRQSPDGLPSPLPAVGLDIIETYALESQAKDRALSPTSCCTTRCASSILPPLPDRL